MKTTTIVLFLTLAAGTIGMSQESITELRAQEITTELVLEMNARIEHRQISPSGFTTLTIEYRDYYTFTVIRLKVRAVIDRHPDAKIFQPWSPTTLKSGAVNYHAIIEIGYHHPKTYMMVNFMPTINHLSVTF